MSLLLDALKKAADDKKKSVDVPTDKSPVQDTRADDEDSLELELDERQVVDSDSVDDNDFPLVEDQPIVKQTQHSTTPADNDVATEAVSDSTDKHQPDTAPVTAQNKPTQDTDKPADTDTAHTAQTAELELTETQTSDTEVKDSPEEKQTKPQAGETEKTAGTQADSHTETEAVHTVSSAVSQADQARNRADNEAALSALINKSNQYQQRAQKKRSILLVTLILLLISGSALFFYFKAEMASQELFIAQNNSAPLLRETAPVTNNSQAAGNQTAVTNAGTNKTDSADTAQHDNTASPGRTSSKPVVNPNSAQTAKSVRTAVENKPAATKIHIQQSSREDPLESLVMDAYNAFQRGQYEQAQSLYQQVLAQEPRNRDAMLGLAAIALKQQRYEVAKQKYLALLQLNPKDSLAIAGLSSINQGSLQHSSDTALSESQLKFMLKEQPDAAHLYFALGSLYAGNNQWPQAQSAYFSAWSADSNKADYAFNLAVSLDHINQPQQALQYYQLSLKLMRNSTASFSAAQVQQRINSLQEAM